ncbi:cytochrome b5 [Lentinula raphanica]|nr:cytochrome b5 [Lentinula raphanica]
MASYLRNWLSLPIPSYPSSTSTSSSDLAPSISLDNDDDVNDDDDGSDTEKEDNDEAPAFPSLNSAQRIQSIPKILTDSELMPPPPVPELRNRTLGVPVTGTAGGLAVPLTTTKPPTKPSKKRGKVALAPGHSPLDWAALKASGKDLRGVDSLMRIPPSILKKHNTREDAWSAFNGKVYNFTPYLSFHPGGEKELMRVAGRDGSKLFALTHAWVNVDFMLDSCLVGFLVPEPSS